MLVDRIANTNIGNYKSEIDKKVIQILMKKNRNKFSMKEDALCLSCDGKRSVKCAIIDSYLNVQSSELTFYFNNADNPKALLDFINFSRGDITGTFTSNASEYGAISIETNGVRQVIPCHAVPSIDASVLDKMVAKGNVLRLCDRSYYAYTAENGKKYTMCVSDGFVGRAITESMKENENNEKGERSGNNHAWTMRKVGNIITALGKGYAQTGYSDKDNLSALSSVGISVGEFTIDIGKGEYKYLLHENGEIEEIE